MAKYTMLLTEYLERGGQLPASFSLIEGFNDLFIKHYCDKELGFETPYLFSIKLEEVADIYMQVYADKISKQTQAWLKFDAPIKVHYTQEDKTFNAGAQHTATTELPINAGTATPSATADMDAYENTEGRGMTLEESGETYDEIENAIEFLNRDIKPLVLKLLDEFKNCFMKVY